MFTTERLGDIIDQWLAVSSSNNATRKSYRGIMYNCWIRYLHRVGANPQNPSAQDVVNYMDDLRDNGYSAYTINNRLSVIKSFYKWCDKNRKYSDIGKDIKYFRQNKYNNKKPLDDEQIVQLISSIDTNTKKGKRDICIVDLMMWNNLRACEVARLNVGDIKGDILYIQRKGHIGKDSPTRLHPIVLEHLESYLKAERLEDGKEPLFASQCRANKYRRCGFTPNAISKLVKKMLVRAGIKDKKITCHSLRHTFGTLMARYNVPLDDIKELMGHTDTKVTLIYVKSAHEQALLKSPPSFPIIAQYYTKVNR